MVLHFNLSSVPWWIESSEVSVYLLGIDRFFYCSWTGSFNVDISTFPDMLQLLNLSIKFNILISSSEYRPSSFQDASPTWYIETMIASTA